MGHRANFCKLVPSDIQSATDWHVEHTFDEVAQYRLDRCKMVTKSSRTGNRRESCEQEASVDI